MPPIFQQAEDRFKALRAQYAGGQISAGQYQAELKSQVVRDERGVYWTIDPNSGGWLKAVGGAWQPGTPYLAATQPPAPPPPAQPAASPPGQAAHAQSKKGRRTAGCGCLAALLLALLFCMLSLAGGYFVLRRGLISSRTIFTLLGHGPGDIAITNLSNTVLGVTVDMLDETTYGYSIAMPTFLDPGDISSYSLEPSRYTFTFRDDTDRVIGACTLRINPGDRYTLMAHGKEVYILRNEQVDPAGIAIPNSGFCIPTEAP